MTPLDDIALSVYARPGEVDASGCIADDGTPNNKSSTYACIERVARFDTTAHARAAFAYAQSLSKDLATGSVKLGDESNVFITESLGIGAATVRTGNGVLTLTCTPGDGSPGHPRSRFDRGGFLDAAAKATDSL
jgi:hypothetical protein